MPVQSSHAPTESNVVGLVGFIVSMTGLVFPPVGIPGAVVSIVGLVHARRLKRAGIANHYWGFSLAGVIVGIGGTITSCVALIAVIVLIAWIPYAIFGY